MINYLEKGLPVAIKERPDINRIIDACIDDLKGMLSHLSTKWELESCIRVISLLTANLVKDFDRTILPKERPRCRAQILKLGLHPINDYDKCFYEAKDNDGNIVSLSDGMRKQMKRMAHQGRWV